MSFGSSSFFVPPGPPVQSNSRFQSINVNGLKVSVKDGSADLNGSDNVQLSGGTTVALRSGNNVYVMPVASGTVGQYLAVSAVVVVDGVSTHTLGWATLT